MNVFACVTLVVLTACSADALPPDSTLTSSDGTRLAYSIDWPSTATVTVILSGPTVSVGTEIRFSNLAERTAVPLDHAYEQLRSMEGPNGFDPASALERVAARVLWLYGADDRSVPTRLCVAIHDRLRQRGKTQSVVKVYPGLGHGLAAGIWPDIALFLGGIPRRE